MATTEDLEKTLGDGIRSLRLSRRFTQVELSDRANVSLGALKHLESGAGATTSTLVKVLRALEADEWLGRLAPPSPPFDPLALLEQRQREQRRAPAPRRVRHRADGS